MMWVLLLIKYWRIIMPAVSRKQQRLMGMALALKKGKLKTASKKIAKVAKMMTKKQLKDFAETERKGLPKRIKRKVKK